MFQNQKERIQSIPPKKTVTEETGDRGRNKVSAKW